MLNWPLRSPLNASSRLPYPKIFEGCGGVQPNQAGSGLIFDIHKFSDARSA
jgi:hypothetical protein